MRLAAHDLGNQLTVSCGYSALAAKALDEALRLVEKARDNLAKAHEVEALSMEIVRSMQRDLALNIQPLKLGAVIGQELNALRRILGDEIEIEVYIPPDLPLILADSLVLRRVFANLADNARRALTGVASPRFQIQASDMRIGVGIVVNDNGIGMPADVLARVNAGDEYSTKENHDGIGLAMVRTGIAQCGGSLRIESAPAQGTSFLIFLPIS
jgi:signal transduction histidine kinase